MSVLRFSCALLLALAVVFPGPHALADDEQSSPLYTRALEISKREGYATITTAALRELLRNGGDLLLLDVRFPYEYDRGHIPGAVNLPVDLDDRGDLPADRRRAFEDILGPDKARPIVIYCRDFR